MLIVEYLILFVSIFILFFLLIILFSLIWTTIIGGVPYVSTDKTRVKQIIKLANIKKGEKAVDLGSGDGRIVIALAQGGAEAHGFELNLFYVLLSRYKIDKAGLRGKAFIHWKNFFTADLSPYDVITSYGVSYIMNKLEKKLKKEVKSTARVITTSYSFKTWKYSRRVEYVFLYKKL